MAKFGQKTSIVDKKWLQPFYIIKKLNYILEEGDVLTK